MNGAAVVARSGDGGRSDGERQEVRGRLARALTHQPVRRHVARDGNEEHPAVDRGRDENGTRYAAADHTLEPAPRRHRVARAVLPAGGWHVAAGFHDGAGCRDVRSHRHRGLSDGDQYRECGPKAGAASFNHALSPQPGGTAQY
jgi:hypothetical protein